jgi:hypothetical protein
VRTHILELSGQEFSKFNDAHFAEMLVAQGILLSRESIRRLRRQAGIAPKRKRRPRKHHKRRTRKTSEGLMILWDGSFHRWFGETPCCLMAAMDDATGKILAALFCERECSWAYLELLRRVVRDHGIPASVYEDKHTALKRNDDFWSLDEELAGRQEPTQVGLALEALGIEAIFANSPQAKGRVEKLFETLQDRLVALLDHAGIVDMAAANAYLGEVFVPDFNERFCVAPKAQHRWRRLKPGADLDRICSFRYEATVAKDNCIRFCSLMLDIEPGPAGRSYASCRVELRQLLDGSWRIYYKEQLIATAPSTELREPFKAKRRPAKGTRGARQCEWVYRVWRQVADGPDAPAGPPTVSVRKAPGQAIQATKVA